MSALVMEHFHFQQIPKLIPLQKLPIQAAKPFELPVDTTHFSDYLNYVQIPMDLSTVEKNIQNGIYVYAEGRFLLL